MGKRRLGKLPRLPTLPAPVAEAGPESVWNSLDAEITQQLREGVVDHAPPGRGGEHEVVLPQFLGLGQDLARPAAERPRCSRPAFIRDAGTVQSPSPPSTSSQVINRTSPDRAAVSTRKSKASLVDVCAFDRRTISSAAATCRCGMLA